MMTAKLPVAALQAVDAAATDHCTDRMAILTDIVCLHYGRRDLMAHRSEQLLLESRTATKELTADGRQLGPHVKLRPPRPVANLIEDEYQRLGIDRSTLLADIVCQHLGFAELVRELDVREEGLPLAM
jgi:hypothetical protein